MRCSLIGVMVGVIPGLGGSVVDWIAYGHTFNVVKKNQNLDGDVRGVIGPESSNNAKRWEELCYETRSGSMAVFIGH